MDRRITLETPNWDKPFARDLVLSDRQTLKTLRDVARLFVDRFESVEDAPPVRRALELLMKAGESGAPSDIEAATEQIAHVLRVWRMMT
jgi:hypothetical protein